MHSDWPRAGTMWSAGAPIGLPDDWSRGASGGRGNIVDALLKEDAPVVPHEPRPDLLSLQQHMRSLSCGEDELQETTGLNFASSTPATQVLASRLESRQHYSAGKSSSTGGLSLDCMRDTCR